MTSEQPFTPVVTLGELTDPSLISEVKKRLEAEPERLRFLRTAALKRVVGLGAKLAASANEKLSDPEYLKDIQELWKTLLEDAIEFLKMRDPREWDRNKHGESPPDEKMRSVKPFGVEDLHAYFVQFSKFESVLYGADQYYRGHVVHVFRVWVVGALLLDDLLPTPNRPVIDFCDYLSEQVRKSKGSITKAMAEKAQKAANNAISDDEIQAMWCVIALTHDLGYPLQSIDKVNEPIRHMLRRYGKVNLQETSINMPQEYHFINDFILKFISSKVIWNAKAAELTKLLAILPNTDGPEKFLSHVQPKYYLKFSKSLMDYKHGIISSVILMKNLIYFLESDFDIDSKKPLSFEDARQSAIRREILRAIASHTCEEIYYIRPNTLSFLLILCDELQCWGRPTFADMEAGVGECEGTGQLIRFAQDHVEFVLRLSAKEVSDLKDRARHLFRRFHKILRTALGARDRSFKFIVEIEGRGDLAGHKYRFRFADEGFQWYEDGKPWNIWLEEKTRPSGVPS